MVNGLWLRKDSIHNVQSSMLKAEVSDESDECLSKQGLLSCGPQVTPDREVAVPPGE